MRSTLSVVNLALAAILLTACTTGSPPMSDPNPPLSMGCDAQAAKPNAIGKVASAEVIERARIDAGAKMARVLKPGQMVTMEFREGRLNIDVDDANVIIDLRCG